MDNQPYSSDPRYQGYQQAPDQAPTEEIPARNPANNTIRASRSDNAQVQSQRESYIDPQGNRVENQTEFYEDRNQQRANIRYWITRVVYFLLGVLEVILVLRFLFKLLGANAGNGFVVFLYNLSYFFVAPFSGIFNNPTIGNNVFEITTIIAMIVYALIAWGLVSLGRLIFAPNFSGRQTYTTTRRGRYQ
jgi:uncharacterized membrane protein